MRQFFALLLACSVRASCNDASLHGKFGELRQIILARVGEPACSALFR